MVPTPPKGSATSLARPKPTASSTSTAATRMAMPRTRVARLAPGGGAIRPMIRSRNSCRLEGGLLAQLLDGRLEVVGAALGQGHRGLHHLPQRGALLGVAAGERLVEVGPGGLGVVLLGRARAQQRLGRHAVLGLAPELLVACGSPAGGSPGARPPASASSSASAWPRPPVWQTVGSGRAQRSAAGRPRSTFPKVDGYRATELTRGPWDPGSQHAGPPCALLGARAGPRRGAGNGAAEPGHVRDPGPGADRPPDA